MNTSPPGYDFKLLWRYHSGNGKSAEAITTRKNIALRNFLALVFGHFDFSQQGS